MRHADSEPLWLTVQYATPCVLLFMQMRAIARAQGRMTEQTGEE